MRDDDPALGLGGDSAGVWSHGRSCFFARARVAVARDTKRAARVVDPAAKARIGAAVRGQSRHFRAYLAVSAVLPVTRRIAEQQQERMIFKTKMA